MRRRECRLQWLLTALLRPLRRRAIVAASLSSICIFAFGAVPIGAGEPATREAATNLPAARPAHAAARPITAQRQVEEAVEALRREYAAAQRHPDKFHLRQQCNYFLECPAPDLKPEAILAALEKPPAGDPQASGYVRWQLLSGLPDLNVESPAPDPRLVARMLDAYRRAPKPIPHFGLSLAEQAQLNALAASSRARDDIAVNAQVQEAQKKVAAVNRFIIDYRDELYHRLPRTRETFLAAFQDGDERLKLAAGAREWMPTVIGDVYAWLDSSDASPSACERLADAVAELRFRAAPSYYDRVVVTKQNKLIWEKRSDTANPEGKLPALQQALTERARKPK